MGCDIHCRAHDADGNDITFRGQWSEADPEYGPGEPFGGRNYGVFGFLAGVRNYSDVTPIAEPRGLPDGVKNNDDNWLGDHSFSWLSVAELSAVDYDAHIEDRRVARRISDNVVNGACTAEPGGGEMMTLRAFLGSGFFADLAELQRIGAERIVFGFDS